MHHLLGTLAFCGGVIMHHDKRRHKQCGENEFFSEIFFHQFSDSQDFTCRMSSNGRCHRVRLAEKLWRIGSDGPKVPQMRRNEKTIFY